MYLCNETVCIECIALKYLLTQNKPSASYFISTKY